MKMRVLHIEDDPRDSDLIRERIESEGIACVFKRVETRNELLEALDQMKYDVVLCDYSLPSYDGVSALREIRELYPHMPFILVSGTIGEVRAIESLKLGATDYVLKDDLTHLVPSIRRAMREVEERLRRRAAEETLAEREVFLHSIIEAEPECVTLLAQDGTVLQMNRAGLTILEADGPEQVVGKNAYDLVSEQFREAFRSLTARTFRGESGNLEFEMITLKGTRRWMDAHAVPLKNQKGEIIASLAIERDVTERKRAEEALRKSEADLRRAQRVATTGSWYADIERNTLEWSEEVYRIFGQNRLTFTPTNEAFLDAVHPDDRETVRAASAESLRSGKRYEVEHRIVRPDGVQRVVYEQAEVVQDERGKSVRLIGVVQDITERKRAEHLQQALYRISYAADHSETVSDLFTSVHKIIQGIMPAENFYIALYDKAKDLLTFPYFVDEVDPPEPPKKPGKGLTEYVLRTGTSLLCDEKTHEELTGRGDAELVGVQSPIWLGVPLRIENQTIGVMTVQHYSNPNAYGEPEKQMLEYVSSQVAKVIHRKQVEEAIRQSEERYRSLVEGARDAIFAIGQDGIITSLNTAFESMTGWSRSEWIGRSFTALIHPADVQVAVMNFQNSVAGNLSDMYELRIKTRSGSYVVGEFTVTPQIQQGAVVGVLGLARDITERRRLEEQLRQAQKMESLGTLAGGIAHDFNNILGIIMGHSSLVEKFRDDKAKLASSIDAIVKATHRGAGLVRQLLTFARKTDVQLESLHVNDSVAEITKLVKETFPKMIKLESHLESRLPSIVADINQLHQVLLNLCVNGRDAMLPKGGILTITTSVLPGEEVRKKFPQASALEYVRVGVKDTGTGMDEATISRIFEPFFTTKEPGKGTGLGLATVYGIVTNLRGFIDVQSSLGLGTEFHVYFPVRQRSVQSYEQVEETVRDAPGGTETLLLIEDEESLRSLVKLILEGKGYTVMTAEDGEEGIRLYAQHRNKIAVVISDLGLPKVNGQEVFMRVRETNSKVPIILASGYVDPVQKSEMLKAGAREFVQKPYVPSQLLQIIRSAIDAAKNS